MITSGEIESLRKLSHEMDDAAQHITERQLYDFSDKIRFLIGLDNKCEYCDGTGDVHSPDGEWRGICSCPAGESLKGLSETTNMFYAACVDLGSISKELGLDPDQGGAGPILAAIRELRDERDKWIDAQYAGNKEDEHSVDRAWNKFNAAISDGPDSPYPGMATAFENYYSQKWADPEWHKETSVWAAAWKQAISSKEPS